LSPIPCGELYFFDGQWEDFIFPCYKAFNFGSCTAGSYKIKKVMTFTHQFNTPFMVNRIGQSRAGIGNIMVNIPKSAAAYLIEILLSPAV